MAVVGAFVMASGFSSANALAAKELTVHDSVQTALASSSLVNNRRSTLLNERGSASGSFNCSVAMQVNITYTSAVMTFACSSRAGDINGLGRTSFVVSGPIAHFAGTLSLTSGTGSYGHASGSDLHMSGVVQRHSDALSAAISGTMNL